MDKENNDEQNNDKKDEDNNEDDDDAPSDADQNDVLLRAMSFKESVKDELEGATAEREIAILSELSHPNIIRLLHEYKPASTGAVGRYMALSFVEGPDVGARKKLGVEDEAGLTEYVSSYALISDAYGVGATLGEI